MGKKPKSAKIGGTKARIDLLWLGQRLSLWVSTISIVMGRQNFATSQECQTSLPYPHAPARHTPEPPIASLGGFLVPGKCPSSQVLGKQHHLMPDMT
jgi:hypothetical protein